MTENLQRIKQSFIAADEDGDNLLNRQEFSKYVTAAYGKPCPPQMYDQLCTHFNKDLELGIDWPTAKSVWKQAQQKPAASPRSQQPTEKVHAHPEIQELRQIFLNTDVDKDGLLLKSEFLEFAKQGFKKNTIPDQMYFSVCEMFHKDPAVGVDWEIALNLWKKSNPDWDKGATTITINNSNNIKKPKRSSMKPPKLLPAKSYSSALTNANTNSLTAENLRRHTSQTERNTENTPSEGNGSEISAARSRASQRFRRQRSSMAGDHNRRGSWDETDAAQIVMQMMENKLKNVQSSLKTERQKRKKVEELAQTILVENEQYKHSLTDLQLQAEKLKTDNSGIKDSLRKLKSQIEDDHQTIQHLKAQRNTMKEERDQSFELLTRMETEHNSKTKRNKQKYKLQLEQLTSGFLKTLGAEPGNDVRDVIQQLKTNNIQLQQRANVLISQLTRKEESLLEALTAVYEITSAGDSFFNNYNSNTAGADDDMKIGSISKTKLQQVGRKITSKIKRNPNENSNSKMSLPKPPQRLNKNK